MRKIVLVLTAAVMLAPYVFRAAKAQSELIQGEKKTRYGLPPEPTQAVSPTDLVLPTSVPESLSVNENKQKASSFVLDVTLSTDEHMLTVEQTTDYLNPAGKNLSEIYFNIYPEAFSADGGGAAVQSIKAERREIHSLKTLKGPCSRLFLPRRCRGRTLQDRNSIQRSDSEHKESLRLAGKHFQLGQFCNHTRRV